MLVCFAVKQEADVLRPWAGKLRRVRVLLTGIGRTNAERAINAELARQAPGLVLSSGFAGGLDPAMPSGTVLVEADPGFPLTPALQAAGARPGRFHCADRIIVSALEKQALGGETGAQAVEMESAVIRAACRARGVPSATVRVISDAAGEDLPLDFGTLMTPDQRLDWTRLVWALVRSPGKVSALLSFRKRLRVAQQRLATVLGQALGNCALAHSSTAAGSGATGKLF
jgi:nucleoside phosphorylase